ncbi:hypothetical protein A9Z05_13010 [Burkholderia sp. A2]|nr:hypothetical protein A9Z05_13010 [Burkholderia sp. A2]
MTLRKVPLYADTSRKLVRLSVDSDILLTYCRPTKHSLTSVETWTARELVKLTSPHQTDNSSRSKP